MTANQIPVEQTDPPKPWPGCQLLDRVFHAGHAVIFTLTRLLRWLDSPSSPGFAESAAILEDWVELFDKHHELIEAIEAEDDTIRIRVLLKARYDPMHPLQQLARAREPIEVGENVSQECSDEPVIRLGGFTGYCHADVLRIAAHSLLEAFQRRTNLIHFQQRRAWDRPTSVAVGILADHWLKVRDDLPDGFRGFPRDRGVLIKGLVCDMSCRVLLCPLMESEKPCYRKGCIFTSIEPTAAPADESQPVSAAPADKIEPPACEEHEMRRRMGQLSGWEQRVMRVLGEAHTRLSTVQLQACLAQKGFSSYRHKTLAVMKTLRALNFVETTRGSQLTPLGHLALKSLPPEPRDGGKSQS